jgi:hypothetical protein
MQKPRPKLYFVAICVGLVYLVFALMAPFFGTWLASGAE